MKIVWSPVALARLATIAAEIAVDHPRAADDWIDSTVAVVARLAAFPESGRAVPEVGRKDVREVMSGSYRVIYRIEPTRVRVLTLRHQRQSTGRRDVPGAS